ncbi:MAG: RNA polymerase sigma factor [Candidatus Poribacteria bacterium]|nr:RNA polymerase sigma factor [Candidatus Poribacteria bacterium]
MQDKTEINDDEILKLIKEHKPLLRNIIALNVHNPVNVDDVYQETLLAILEHFRKGRPVEHLKAWMVKIAKNQCIASHRREQREANRDIDLASFINPAAFGGGVSIADEQHQEVVVQEILDVIARMKPIYRNVGKLHIQGYNTPEISELLGIPEGTVTSRLRTFRRLIREYLETDAPPPEQEKT